MSPGCEILNNVITIIINLRQQGTYFLYCGIFLCSDMTSQAQAQLCISCVRNSPELIFLFYYSFLIYCHFTTKCMSSLLLCKVTLAICLSMLTLLLNQWLWLIYLKQIWKHCVPERCSRDMKWAFSWQLNGPWAKCLIKQKGFKRVCCNCSLKSHSFENWCFSNRYNATVIFIHSFFL